MSTPPLSSDILENQFGPTTVRIVHQTNTLRIIQTAVIATGQILELSLVRFDPSGIRAFPAVHAAITAGASMGKAFRAAGIIFMRQEIFAARLAVPAAIEEMFLAKQPAIIVGVTALVGPARVPYANVLETYTGTVRWPKLFGQPTPEAIKTLTTLARYT